MTVPQFILPTIDEPLVSFPFLAFMISVVRNTLVHTFYFFKFFILYSEIAILYSEIAD